MPQPASLARPVIAATAVAAPLLSALAVASFHTHSSDAGRQLDLIKANIAGFTGMILLEHLTWVCIAVAASATAIRIRNRGAWPAAIGAVLAVLGAAGSLGDFGSALLPLARMQDRSAAVWFVNHLGPVYSVASVLSGATLIGLLLMFVGLWRARLVHVAFLGTFVVGGVLMSFTGGNAIGELASFALLAVALSQVTRLLLRPAGTPDKVTAQGAAAPEPRDATPARPA
jgi:hypothetical protein